MTFTSEDFSKLKSKIDQVKVGMLTTMDGSNYLFSRPMTSQQLDEEGYLWFF
ncbi:pyridoxamine 5'-phosphate oxidase family protein, partial [Undibacterium sp.]|uniref:pyridoxamine 5'-phosphate oxidase family protein n=1 Tax=Undibacterium sp. TaxID=1914977 RepID=UPI00374D71BB